MQPDVFIHESADVEPGALIGAGSRVWHHSHVRASARIGARCSLGKNVYVGGGASVGDGCKIQNNVSIYDGVHLAEDVFVGPAATFTNDRAPRAFNDSWTLVQTWVARGASIGANATIVCGHRLGEFSMIAAGAVVTRDIADHELVAGIPARTIGWVCRCGTVVSRAAEPPVELRCATCRASEGSA